MLKAMQLVTVAKRASGTEERRMNGSMKV